MGVVLKFYWYVLLSIEFVSRHFLIRMSWQDYVDKNLVGTGKVKKAGIYGLNGAKWAASSGFNVTATEVKNLLAGLSDNSKLQTSGVVVQEPNICCSELRIVRFTERREPPAFALSKLARPSLWVSTTRAFNLVLATQL